MFVIALWGLASAVYREATLPFLRIDAPSSDGFTIEEGPQRRRVVVNVYNVFSWKSFYVCVDVAGDSACFGEASIVPGRDATFRNKAVLDLHLAWPAQFDDRLVASLVAADAPPLQLATIQKTPWTAHVVSQDVVQFRRPIATPALVEKNEEHWLVELAEASLASTTLPDWVLDVEGLVSRPTRDFINAVVKGWPRTVHYVEVGVFRGASLCAASYKTPHARVVGIDNWFFEPNRRQALDNVQMCADADDAAQVEVVEADAWDYAANHTRSEKIDVFFYDGGHEASEQYRGLVDFAPKFADEVLVLVDDMHERVVYDATRAAVEVMTGGLNFRLLYSNYQLDTTPGRESNAILVFAKKKTT